MAVLIRGIAAPSSSRRQTPDAVMAVAFILLAALGVVMVYSASRVVLEAQNLDPAAWMRRQMVFAGIGVLVFLIGSLIDYREYARWLPWIYGATLILLSVVFLFAKVKGAHRWIPLGPIQLQPSEFAKPVIILGLAAMLAPSEEEHLSWLRVGQALAFVGIPAMLIVAEPDLGTMLVLAFVALVMLFVAGSSGRQLFALVTSGVVGIVAVLRLGLLEDFQANRLRSIFNPGADPLGLDYHRIQSERTIGSGQLFGKGLFQGSQTNLSFVPEQPTDFIFTAVGEQLGFIGGLLVLIAYALIVWRLLVIARSARDRFGSLVVAGIAAMFSFHIFVNIGMTIGIAPITGLPLPFMSMGGSSFTAMAASLAIAQSVWLRRSKVPRGAGRPLRS